MSSIADFDDNDLDPILGLQQFEVDDFVSFFFFFLIHVLLLNVFNFNYLFFWTFNAFLNRMPIMFEYSASKITNINADGGRIFLDLGQILVYYFKKRGRFQGMF